MVLDSPTAPTGARPALNERANIEIAGREIDEIAATVWDLLISSAAPLAVTPRGKLLTYHYNQWKIADIVDLRGLVIHQAKFFRNGKILLKPADTLIRLMLRNPDSRLPELESGLR